METDEDIIINWMIERAMRTMCDNDTEYVVELAKAFPLAVEALTAVLTIPDYESGFTQEFNEGRAYALRLVRRSIAEVLSK